MWPCELARPFSLFSTVENGCGNVEASYFLLFHTPYKGVEEWKRKDAAKKESRTGRLSVKHGYNHTLDSAYPYALSLSQKSAQPLTLKRKRYAVTQNEFWVNAYPYPLTTVADLPEPLTLKP